MFPLLPFVLAVLLTSCSSSVPPTTSPAATAVASDASRADKRLTKADRDEAVNAYVQMQREKLAQVTRQYQQCRDLGDFKRMIRIARARHAELEIDIRQLYKSKLTEEERERVLTPMRQERNWHLEVIQAVSEN